MNTPQPRPTLTLDDFRAQSRTIHKARDEARINYENHAAEAAQAESEYRKKLAGAFAEAKRFDGVTAAQAELEAHAEASETRLKRDLAQSLAKSALLRIEALEADRATLRSIGDWSRAIDATGAGSVAA